MGKTLDESVGALLGAMEAVSGQHQSPVSFAIGEVKVGTQEGLRVQCGGNLLTEKDIWINEALLVGYSPKLTGTLLGTCPDGETVTPVSKDQLKRSEFALKAGDRVVLLTQDEQAYYLICKVVRLE